MKRIALLFLLFPFLLPGQRMAIELMTYNLMYYKAPSTPCSHSRSGAQRDTDLKTVVQYVKPDILCVTEMGATPLNPPVIASSILNVDGTSHYQYANFSSSSFSSIANGFFYNANKLALLSQSSVKRDLNNVPLVREVNFYRLYVKDQALSQANADTTFFSVGVVHFKAGSDPSDQTARQEAAAAIMDHIDQNISDENVILTGDFNMRGPGETAFQTLTQYTASPDESLQDPLSLGGRWHNRSNMASHHTQSTHRSSQGCFVGGGMDDRFDLFLVSDEIRNGSNKLHYLQYDALGQDGSSFNGSLNRSSNFEVNTAVANALYNFSDHLPVLMEIEAEVSGIGLDERAYLQEHLQVRNPFVHRLKLEHSGLKKQSHRVQISDLTGRTMASEVWPGGPNVSPLHFDTSNWPAGIYLLTLQSENASYTRKLIKR